MLVSQPPARACAFDSEHARLFDLGAGALGALQQHAVQIEARIDHERLVAASASLRRRCGAASTVSVISFFGVSLSIRNGYWL